MLSDSRSIFGGMKRKIITGYLAWRQVIKDTFYGMKEARGIIRFRIILLDGIDKLVELIENYTTRLHGCVGWPVIGVERPRQVCFVSGLFTMAAEPACYFLGFRPIFESTVRRVAFPIAINLEQISCATCLGLGNDWHGAIVLSAIGTAETGIDGKESVSCGLIITV